MDKVKTFLKKYQLIILLAITASLLLGIKIFLLPKEEVKIGQPTPTPTATPSPIKEDYGRGVTEEELEEVLRKDIVEKFPLSPYLPYPDRNIAIVYTGSLVLEIIIKNGDSLEKREKILNWIENQGIDPQTHTITWR